MTDKRIAIELSEAEALVLFEFLARFDEAGEVAIEDEAELNVLWLVEGQLEQTLVAPLRPDYDQLVRNAREAVRGRADRSAPGAPKGSDERDPTDSDDNKGA